MPEILDKPDKLEKVLDSWKFVVTKGQVGKQLEEHIIETIKLLEELKVKREE